MNIVIFYWNVFLLFIIINLLKISEYHFVHDKGHLLQGTSMSLLYDWEHKYEYPLWK